MSTVNPLNNEQLRQRAPAIFTMEPHVYMSDKYRFVPTIKVVDKLRTEGFLPVAAGQGKERIPGTARYAKHVVRFRRKKDIEVMARGRKVGDELPEIVLINSHNGGSSYQLLAGLFRLICLNGMVVSSANFGSLHFKHQGIEELPREIIDASYKIIEHTPKVLAQVDTMRARFLSPPRQIEFAQEAVKLRNTSLDIEPGLLLEARRVEDQPEKNGGTRSLWRTFNVIQENLTKGGSQGTTTRGATRRLSSISNLADDAYFNQRLWGLAEGLLKAA